MTIALGAGEEAAVRAEFPATQPLDEHNQMLLANVHPRDWQEPLPKSRYHMVVIGAGTGGLVTAAAAAGLGATVALVERELMGGDCLNVGCVPSKAIIRAARAWRAAHEAQRAFAGPRVESVDSAEDFAAVMTRMRRLRARLSPVDSAARFRDLGVDVFLGHARFGDAQTVEVNGTRLRFRRAVIATGARAALPPIPGLAQSGYLTNETIFSLTQRPKRLVVVGAGPIGCELSQAFALLGCDVTLIERGTRILPNDDADAAAVIADALRVDGVRLLLGATITRVDERDSRKTVHFTRGGRDEVSCDALLVASGRTPNVDQLGLEAAHVRYNSDGITVDDRLRTSNPRVYAVGDVCSPLKFTHAADFQARAVVQNALFFGRVRASRLVIPWATYTSPELAHVGLSEAAAWERGIPVDTVTLPLHEVDRAVLDGEDEGLLRITLRKGSDRILGVTLVAEHASEMIGEIAVAMTNGLGLSAIGKTIHPYPTQAEVFRKAADAWRRRKLTPFVKRAFATFFRVVR